MLGLTETIEKEVIDFNAQLNNSQTAIMLDENKKDLGKKNTQIIVLWEGTTCASVHKSAVSWRQSMATVIESLMLFMYHSKSPP